MPMHMLAHRSTHTVTRTRLASKYASKCAHRCIRSHTRLHSLSHVHTRAYDTCYRYCSVCCCWVQVRCWHDWAQACWTAWTPYGQVMLVTTPLGACAMRDADVVHRVCDSRLLELFMYPLPVSACSRSDVFFTHSHCAWPRRHAHAS